MLRAILSVIAGYVVVGIWVVTTSIATLLVLGADFARDEGTYDASIGWCIVSIVLGAIGAVLAGLVTASIARTATPVKVLAGILLVFGLGLAVMYPESTEQAVPAEELSWWEADKTYRPAWYLFTLPLVGSAGVVIGGRIRRRSESN